MDDLLPPIVTSGILLSFDVIATVPASNGSAPLARVQEVLSVPGLPGRYAALDTRGIVSIVGAGDATTLIDLRGELGFIEPGPESGLRSIAFHPDFDQVGEAGFGKVYLAYSATVASATAGTTLFTSSMAAGFHDVVAEFTVSDPAAPTASVASVRELFRVEQPFGNHNFGQMRFNSEAVPGDADYGLLYMGLGDGGGGNDPLNAGGDLGQIYGKILRINPLQSGADAYTIPASNPFVATAGALDEIYAYGLRNPQSLSFDEGRLYVGDIGQNVIEEVNIILPGENYGWDDREGTFANTDGVISDLPTDDVNLGLQYPFVQYDHAEITTGGQATNGGFVYRGDDIPALYGQLIFGNFPTGEIFTASTAGVAAALADGVFGAAETGAPQRVDVVDASGNVSSFQALAGSATARIDLRFTEADDGEILAFSKRTGEIYQFTSAADDELIGDDGDNVLRGGFGDDSIFGGDGNDLLIGDGLSGDLADILAELGVL